jgi:hypothetical protein
MINVNDIISLVFCQVKYPVENAAAFEGLPNQQRRERKCLKKNFLKAGW